MKGKIGRVSQRTIPLVIVVGAFACTPMLGSSSPDFNVRPVSTALNPNFPADQGSYYDSAVAAIQDRDYGRALEFLQAARAADPNSARVLNAFGVVYDKLGRFDLSARYYAQASAADPHSQIIARNLAYSKVLQGLLNGDVPPAQLASNGQASGAPQIVETQTTVVPGVSAQTQALLPQAAQAALQSTLTNAMPADATADAAAGNTAATLGHPVSEARVDLPDFSPQNIAPVNLDLPVAYNAASLVPFPVKEPGTNTLAANLHADTPSLNTLLPHVAAAPSMMLASASSPVVPARPVPAALTTPAQTVPQLTARPARMQLANVPDANRAAEFELAALVESRDIAPAFSASTPLVAAAPANASTSPSAVAPSTQKAALLKAQAMPHLAAVHKHAVAARLQKLAVVKSKRVAPVVARSAAPVVAVKTATRPVILAQANVPSQPATRAPRQISALIRPTAVAVRQPVPVAPVRAAFVKNPQPATVATVQRPAATTPLPTTALLVHHPLVIVYSPAQKAAGESIRRALMRRNWSIARARYVDAHKHPYTTIIYGPGDAAVAKALVRTLKFPVHLVADSCHCVGLRLVIGSNVSGRRFSELVNPQPASTMLAAAQPNISRGTRRW